MNPGTVYLVGAGPGDPSLLTLRAAELIARADTLVHDRLVHEDVLRRARAGARVIWAGKEGGGDSVPQAEITDLLVAQARLGRTVVRLKGGDPFLFGRGGEEALALSEAGIPWEIVPGVTAGIAVPARAGIPVTHRGVSASVTLATATLAAGDADWAHLAAAPTLVLFMGGARLAHAVRELIAAGRSPRAPSALVEAGTWDHERVIEAPLEELPLAAAGAGSPALVIVGDVVALRSSLSSLRAGLAAREVLP